jgi:two-component system, chemotaxis family, protein-glutamate methylesterase/glutaminase
VTSPTTVAIASSAGGFKALSAVLGDLPSDLPAPVLVVQHLDPNRRTLIASLLARRCALSVEMASDGRVIQPSRVYIAPPDHHLLVNPEGALSITRTELVHFVRPSADLLFESVAAAYRDRVVAVVLSGSGIDGSLGVTAVKKLGGTVIAQDPAEFSGMPSAAIETGSVDMVLPLDRIAPAIVELCGALET